MFWFHLRLGFWKGLLSEIILDLCLSMLNKIWNSVKHRNLDLRLFEPLHRPLVLVYWCLFDLYKREIFNFNLWFRVFFSFLPCEYQHWDLRKKGCKIKLKHFWFLNLKSIIPSLTKERLHIWEICISISAFYNFLSICANVCSLSLSFFDTHRHGFCNVSLSCCFCR